jgi:hypothetical protein
VGAGLPITGKTRVKPESPGEEAIGTGQPSDEVRRPRPHQSSPRVREMVGYSGGGLTDARESPGQNLFLAAEADGNRTRRARIARSSGFEGMSVLVAAFKAVTSGFVFGRRPRTCKDL